MHGFYTDTQITNMKYKQTEKQNGKQKFSINRQTEKTLLLTKIKLKIEKREKE